MTINRAIAGPLLKVAAFKPLFIEELGWNHCSLAIPALTIGGARHSFEPIAEKHGFAVFVVQQTSLPDYRTRREIERQLAKSVHEHLIIFIDSAKKAQIWQWVKREVGRPAACREHQYSHEQHGEALLQKLEHIAFSLDDEGTLGIGAVAAAVQRALDIERVTKRFYDRFQIEHKAFLGLIDGLAGLNRDWYASLMLNRLMFVYFIQKKGFLNNDPNYLPNKLQEVRQSRGKDKFQTFYRAFLLKLFHDGLGGKPPRSKRTDILIGTVPYLNGGLFDPHQLELDNPQIDIPDKAFERIFSFFDGYQWHLDERPVRNDNEINPDVLGYIFEKYINQKQMGAYYTKEDITGYIGENTVLPFLLQRSRAGCEIAFSGDASVWELLSKDPSRYLHPAMKTGVVDSRGALVPESRLGDLHDRCMPASAGNVWERRDGIEDTDSLSQVPKQVMLPTETWRDYAARRQRCVKLLETLANGGVRSIDGLLTRNLDLRQFMQDVIENCEGPELLRAVWRAIVGGTDAPGGRFVRGITILDPTCGSGAFLFAALGILEPLYEACLTRMASFVDDASRLGKNNAYPDFEAVLRAVRNHPSHRYFIYKSIILNNLFGVDSMPEAVDICKLRLFLKLVSQVENVNELEPLPDIDFNIRAGNSLVGYATYDELKRAVDSGFDFENVMQKIAHKASALQATFDEFRRSQTSSDGPVTAEQKRQLQTQLTSLEQELDRHLARECGVKLSSKTAYEAWVGSHQPFHWFIEFYEIMTTGGFDVIVGNPPYAEIPKTLGRALLQRTFRSALDRWSRDEDLCTLIVERSLHLLRAGSGMFGMILPLSIAFSTKRPFVLLRNALREENGMWLWSHFDRIPSALFGAEVRTRCTIALLSRRSEPGNLSAWTTSLLRWNAECREYLFDTLHYSQLRVPFSLGIPKVGSQIQADALHTLLRANTPLGRDLTSSIPFNELAAVAPDFPPRSVYVGGTAYNWFPAWRDIPETTNADGDPSLPARTAGFRFTTDEEANIVFALLCSSLGYWWWAVASDGFNLKKWLIERFPVSLSMIPKDARKPLAKLGSALRRELRRNYVYKDNKGRIGNFYLPACVSQTLAIDAFLGTHVPGLSLEFFEDIRTFNAHFSRAESTADDQDDSE